MVCVRFCQSLCKICRATLPKHVSDDVWNVMLCRKTNWRTFCSKKNSFSLNLWGFWGATANWTSESDSASNFALEPLILRPVRQEIMRKHRFCGAEGGGNLTLTVLYANRDTPLISKTNYALKRCLYVRILSARRPTTRGLFLLILSAHSALSVYS